MGDGHRGHQRLRAEIGRFREVPADEGDGAPRVEGMALHPMLAALPRSSEGLYLLQRVRDEAHRFAITHHRLRRDRAMTESVLDGLPGVGPVRKRALLAHFGSPDAVLAALADTEGTADG